MKLLLDGLSKALSIAALKSLVKEGKQKQGTKILAQKVFKILFSCYTKLLHWTELNS